MNPRLQEARERRRRERYAFVRNLNHDLYGRIAAFSSTFMVWKDGEIDQLASQAAVEDFCMGLVKDLCEDRTP